MPRPATGQVVIRDGARGITFALRFRAYGKRQYVTLGGPPQWSRERAETELQNVLADVRRGIWQPPGPVVAEPAPEHDPTFHEFASDWLEARRVEGLAPRTYEDYKWALTVHLLPHFARRLVSSLTVRDVDQYRTAKVAEGGLSASSINKTITRLAQVLEVAVEYGLLPHNPAAGRRRKLKAGTPRRASLTGEQVQALLDNARTNRALLATAIMAGGLRVSEVTGLRWRDVNLAIGRLTVTASKTEAGVRDVDLEPELRDVLAEHKAASRYARPDDFVFPTRRGTRQDRNNPRKRALRRAIDAANAKLAKDEKPLIPEHTTFHSLRRTYASLMAERGVDMAYVKRQIGHRSAKLTLEVYADAAARQLQPGGLGALLVPADWARMGTNDDPGENTEAAIPDGA